jgi:hypothetical protein
MESHAHVQDAFAHDPEVHALRLQVVHTTRVGKLVVILNFFDYAASKGRDVARVVPCRHLAFFFNVEYNTVFFSQGSTRKMATLQALLDALNGQHRDPRLAQPQTCALCGANPDDLRAVLDREAKQQKINANQQEFLKMYARDCDELARKLAQAQDAIEEKEKQMQVMQKQRAEDIALLKKAMHELERARDAMKPA